MNKPTESSHKKGALPLRGLHTVPEQGHDVEASAHSQGSGASRRKKENSSSEATSATKSSSRPRSERRRRENQEAAYDDERERRRTRQEEEEVRRQRQFMRQEEEYMRRASRAPPQYSERVPRNRPDDGPRFYASRDPRQSRRCLDEQEEFSFIEEPRRQSSVARRVYVEPERIPRSRTRSRAPAVPVGPRPSRASSARMASAYAEAPGRPRNSGYYFDNFDDDSFTSIDDSYYYPAEEDFMPPPLEERVYVDSAGRPYRVIAPVEPRRRPYRPGRDYLTSPIPPPAQNFMRYVGYHRPSSNRMPHRDYDYDSDDRYRQQHPRGPPRRFYAEDGYEEFERKQGDLRRGSRYVRPSRRVVEGPERRRERPSARISTKKPHIADDIMQASEDGRESTVRKSTPRKPCVEPGKDGAEEDGIEDNDGSRIQDMSPRDQRGRLQRRHSIGSAHSRELVLEDMHAVQLENQREHRRYNIDALQRRTVQGRLDSSSSQFVEWSPPPSARRQKMPTKEREFYRESHDPGPMHRSSSNLSFDTTSYFEEEHSASMRPVGDARPYYHDNEYVEENYRRQGQLRFRRRHSFGSMSEYTMDRSYMEESYPSVF